MQRRLPVRGGEPLDHLLACLQRRQSAPGDVQLCSPAEKLQVQLAQLAGLPQGRTPTAKDWETISQAIRARLNERIAELTRTRDRLDGCIGCGCLSLTHCAIWNPQDQLGEEGPGPRKLIGG